MDKNRILEGAFMVRLLQPWHVNLGKRLVKPPKLYLRDSGILYALLAIRSSREGGFPLASRPPRTRVGAAVAEARCRQSRAIARPTVG
jgi:predicted AAA+ superfamily ATPase